MAPVEVLLPGGETDPRIAGLRRVFPSLVFTTRPEPEFELSNARDLILDRYGLQSLKGIGMDDAREATGCAGALLAYLRDTQRETAPQLQLPRRYNPAGYVVIDGSTQ